MLRRFFACELLLACPCLATAQIASLQLKIVEGEGASHLILSRSPAPITVEVADDTGRPVPGAAVSFQLPEDGPGGLFSNGLRTDVVITDAQGRATVRNLHFNSTPGAFQIRILASKDQARAGTISRQHLVARTEAGPKAAVAGAKSSRKWIVIAVAMGGAAAGGTFAGINRANTKPPVAAAQPALSVGPPTITIGRP
jgi:hypothetical protein